MDNIPRRHSLEPTFKEFGPALAEDFSKIVDFMSVDSDRVLFRRFSKVNLYNLLFLQHRLGLISHEIELFTSQNDVDKLQKLLPSLNAALESYNSALLSYERLAKMTRPSNELVDILRSSALENIIELKHQLDPQNGWSELVAPEENEKGWARKLVEKHEWLQKLFHNRRPNVVSSIFTYSAIQVDRAEGIVLNIAFCLFVIAPVCILSYLSNKAVKLLVVFLFVCLTSIVASFLSNLVQKTSLALMAGYTAILVVFLSNNVELG